MEPVNRPPPEVRLRAAAVGGEWDQVRDVLVEDWTVLLQRSPEALLEALERVPDAVLAREPRLRLARDYVARLVRGAEQPVVYRHVVAGAASTGALDALTILTGRIAAARSGGRRHDALRLVTAAHELLNAQPIEQHPALASALPEFHYQWGLALERAGELEAALRDYVESFDWALATGHRMMQTAAAGAVAYLHGVYGRIIDARIWLGKLPETGPEDWWAPAAGVQARLAESLVSAARLEKGVADPLQGVAASEVLKHWAPYYFVRSLAVHGERPARLLRHELDSFLAALPPGQRTDEVNAAYLDVIRLMLAVRAHETGALTSVDRPSPAAHLLLQFAASVRAVRLARAGKHRLALQIAEPLLRVDGSRPRILTLALVATAVATNDDHRRGILLEEAANIAHANTAYTAFTTLPDDLRTQVADLLADLGAETIADHLRRQRPMPAGPTFAALSPRERVVVEHAVAGESVSEIAATLRVSVNTVKSQLHSSYRKLGVSSRTELTTLHRHLRPE